MRIEQNNTKQQIRFLSICYQLIRMRIISTRYVSRSVVVQPTFLGGFAVVDIKLKVMSLLVQWVRRLVSSSSSWLCFLDYWFRHHFSSSIAHVFSHPYSFDPKVLPPFYRSLMYTWRAMDGSGSSTLSSLSWLLLLTLFSPLLLLLRPLSLVICIS